MWQLSTRHFHCIDNYLHSTYIVLGIVLMAKNTHMKKLRETILTHWTKSSMAEVFQEWECAINQSSHSVVSDSATPWTTARQASLSITNSWSPPKPMFIESVMPSKHLILCRPLLFLPPIPPSIRVFPMSRLFTWGGQSIGISASALVLPMNTQDWSPLGWTGWITLQWNFLYSRFLTPSLWW